MAASGNPSAGYSNSNTDNGGGRSGGQEDSMARSTQAALRYNPGLSVVWSPEEQFTLENLLTKYDFDTTIVRYAKISQALEDKTVRDVALRCRWMTIMSNSHRVCISNDCDDGGADKVFLTNKKEIQNKRPRESYAKRKEFRGNKERRIGRPSRASQLQDSHFGDGVLCDTEALASCSIILGPESCTDTTGVRKSKKRSQVSCREYYCYKLQIRTSGLFFLDGPGGTGKTFLYKALLRAVRERNLIALATASSGVAASLLPGPRKIKQRALDQEHGSCILTANCLVPFSQAIGSEDRKPAKIFLYDSSSENTV